MNSLRRTLKRMVEGSPTPPQHGPDGPYTTGILRSLKERSTEGLVKKTYTVEASPNVIKNLDRLLAHMQYCANVGHSALVGISIDGDGADRFWVTKPELPKLDEDDIVDREARVETVRYSD